MTESERPQERTLARERQRGVAMESPEFHGTLQSLLEGLDIEIFAEDWERVTIVNRAKELALKVHLDGADPWTARRELEEFYARKRRFFLDEGDDD